MEMNSRRSGELWKGVIVLLALTLVFFFSGGVQGYMRGIFVSIFSPHAGQNSEYASLSRDALIARLTEDEKDLARVRYQALLYGLLSDENKHLRQAVAAAAIPPGVTARVIARPPETHYDTLVIDAGTNAGIEENDTAVFEGVLLGKVVSAGARSATVQLFSSGGSEEDVIIGNPSAVAVARGLGGGAFELSVPQGVKVAAGDRVRVSGSETLILGIVRSVSAEARDASQKVRFATPVSLNDLDFIRIIPKMK
jgi:cell shape-determining protein MreC